MCVETGGPDSDLKRERFDVGEGGGTRNDRSRSSIDPLRRGLVLPVDRALDRLFLESRAAGLHIGATQPDDVGSKRGFVGGGPDSEADALTGTDGQTIGVAGEQGFIQNGVSPLD